MRNGKKQGFLVLGIIIFNLSIISPLLGQENKNSDEYTQSLYAAGRFVLGFSFLVGIATAQSFVSQQVSDYPLLNSAANYVFMPLTLSFSMLTLTPLQSWVGKYLHGAFAPPDNVKEKALPEDSLEGLWFRTYQAYSMNAQMSRNVVLALNTLSFFYLDRVQSCLESGQVKAGLYTQIHFFQMAEKYFAEVPFQSPIWEDVFIPHAKIVWGKYQKEAYQLINRDEFSEGAFNLFARTVLEIESDMADF